MFLALVGGQYEGALSYEPFPFDTDYLVPPVGPYDQVNTKDDPLLDGNVLPLVTPSTTAIEDVSNVSLSGRTNSSTNPSSSVADLISHIILSDATDESPGVPSIEKDDSLKTA